MVVGWIPVICAPQKSSMVTRIHFLALCQAPCQKVSSASHGPILWISTKSAKSTNPLFCCFPEKSQPSRRSPDFVQIHKIQESIIARSAVVGGPKTLFKGAEPKRSVPQPPQKGTKSQNKNVYKKGRVKFIPPGEGPFIYHCLFFYFIRKS